MLDSLKTLVLGYGDFDVLLVSLMFMKPITEWQTFWKRKVRPTNFVFFLPLFYSGAFIGNQQPVKYDTKSRPTMEENDEKQTLQTLQKNCVGKCNFALRYCTWSTPIETSHNALLFLKPLCRIVLSWHAFCVRNTNKS